FLDQLRRRFAYGIVDEFQDTDPLQWQIFARIFLDGRKSRLMVVGDPKQAIYGFRGADLPTYVQAVQAMKNPHSANTYPLTTNWRSIKDLLEPLNCLFEYSGWFDANSKMPFQPAVPCAEAERTIVKAGSLKRKPLSVVDL